MSRLWFALLLVGCGDKDTKDDEGSDTGNSIFPPGPPVIGVWNYAGITGNRSWLYSRTDTAQMIVDDAGAIENGTASVNTLTYAADDPEQQLEFRHTIEWAAGADLGIEIRSYNGTTYSQPIKVANPVSFITNITTTQVEGSVFQSTLIGFEECPNSWTSEWTCLHIQITGGNGEYFVGDWWLADGWGTAIFQPESESLPWVLRQTQK